MLGVDISRTSTKGVLFTGNQLALRKVIAKGVTSRQSFPKLSVVLTYYDSYRLSQSNANLLQAQRDYFGAHTYEVIDQEGSFHMRVDIMSRT